MVKPEKRKILLRQIFNFIQSLAESRLELLQQYSEEVEDLMDDKLKDFIEYTDNPY